MLKKLTLIVLSVVFACALLLVLLWALVDPNDYRDDISAIARDKAGIELSLGGDLGWSFYPVLGFSANHVAIALQADAPQLVAIRSVDFGVRLLPLLSGRIEIDALAVEGLQADLRVDANGANNWTLPESAQQAAGQPTDAKEAATPIAAELLIPLVRVADSSIHYSDLSTASDYTLDVSLLELQDVNFSSAFPLRLLARLRDKGGMDVALQLDSQLALDPGTGLYGLDPLQLQWQAEGLTPAPLTGVLSGRATFNQQADTARLDLREVTLVNTVSSLVVDATALSTSPTYSGTFSTAAFNARELASALAIELPPMADPKALTNVQWRLPFAGDDHSVRIAPLQARLDDSTLSGELNVIDLSTQALRFALQVDRLDVDRYSAASGPAGPAASPPPGQQGEGEDLLPVELLRGLDIQGTLRAGEVVASDIALNDMVVAVVATGGDVTIDMQQGSLLGGTLTGKIAIDARAAEPQLVTQLNASNIGLGGLLKPFTGVEVLSGKTSLVLDSHSQGNTLDSLLRAALGQIDLQMSEAIVHGVNVNQLALDKIREQLVDVTALYPDYQTKLPTSLKSDTELNELITKLRIEKGHLILPDTHATSSDGSLKLAGNIDLLQQGLDLRFDVVLDALGGNKYLKNTAWPVRCQGQWQDPVLSWCRPDSKAFNQTLQAALKQAVRDKSAGKIADKLGLDSEDEASLEQEARDKAKAEEDRAKQKLKEALDKKLKGLFN